MLLVSLAATACAKYKPPVTKYVPPPLGPDSFVDVKLWTEPRTVTISEESGRVCSDQSGNCFTSYKDKQTQIDVPLASATLDGREIDEAALRVIADDKRDQRLARLPHMEKRCINTGRITLVGLLMIFPGSIGTGVAAGVITDNRTATILGLAGGAALGATGVIWGIARGLFSCRANFEREYNELEVSDIKGKAKWEGDVPVKEIELLAARFNERHGGASRAAEVSANFRVGDSVKAQWTVDNRWYSAKVLRVTPNGMIEVRFDSDGIVQALSPSRVQAQAAVAPLPPSPPPPSASRPGGPPPRTAPRPQTTPPGGKPGKPGKPLFKRH